MQRSSYSSNNYCLLIKNVQKIADELKFSAKKSVVKLNYSEKKIFHFQQMAILLYVLLFKKLSTLTRCNILAVFILTSTTLGLRLHKIFCLM